MVVRRNASDSRVYNVRALVEPRGTDVRALPSPLLPEGVPGLEALQQRRTEIAFLRGAGNACPSVPLAPGRLNLERRETKACAVYSGGGATLAMPHSYMNVCGPYIKDALMKAGGDPAALLVVSDDFMLPEGRLRFRREGSAGGHNGLKSVIEALGTDAFPRLRIGVGPVPEGMDPADYVLKRVAASRMEALAAKAADALEMCLAEGDKDGHRRHGESARMHLLYAREACAKDAASRPKARVDPLAQFMPHVRVADAPAISTDVVPSTEPERAAR